MKKTPIVFIFNDDYLLPAGVCIFSLLENKKDDSIYEIYVLYIKGRLSEKSIAIMEKMVDTYDNCSIRFKQIENRFANNRTVRHISIDAYCKFEIPKLLNHYERIVYADVDMIFDDDISELVNIPFQESIAAVRIPIGHVSIDFKSLEIDEKDYFNSGLIVMNVKKITDNEIIEQKLIPLIGNKYDHVDQDILNITFKQDTYFLSSIYNFSPDRLIKDTEIRNSAVKIYHYAGGKPWDKDKFPPLSDIWWEYYRKSPFYSEKEYFAKQLEYNKLSKYLKLGTLANKIGLFSLWNMLKKQ